MERRVDRPLEYCILHGNIVALCEPIENAEVKAGDRFNECTDEYGQEPEKDDDGNSEHAERI